MRFAALKDVQQLLSGDKLYERRARAALPLLVRQVMHGNGQSITYSDFAAEIGMPNPRNLNYVFAKVGAALKGLSDAWDEKVPPIQCLVVSKSDRFPGEGVGWFVKNKKKFRLLPLSKRREALQQALRDVTEYRRWPEVLNALGLSEAQSSTSSSLSTPKSIGATSESRGSSFGAGGESDRHRVLRKYVANHPAVVGLPKTLDPGEMEWPLLSGDRLDVFFMHGDCAVAVEVKSAISAEADVLRGIYQCVKYRAVLKAQQAALNRPRSARVILVLEAKLPKALWRDKNLHGIELIEGVIPE